MDEQQKSAIDQIADYFNQRLVAACEQPKPVDPAKHPRKRDDRTHANQVTGQKFELGTWKLWY